MWTHYGSAVFVYGVMVADACSEDWARMLCDMGNSAEMLHQALLQQQAAKDNVLPFRGKK
jgi:hypothetical protein